LFDIEDDTIKTTKKSIVSSNWFNYKIKGKEARRYI
jgi:hypothetical protein